MGVLEAQRTLLRRSGEQSPEEEAGKELGSRVSLTKDLWRLVRIYHDYDPEEVAVRCAGPDEEVTAIG